jgi:cobalt-zinc-cadmium efflux system membrane fusion protein
MYNSTCDLKVKEVQLLKTIGDKTFIKAGLKQGDKILCSYQILFYKALTEE